MAALIAQGDGDFVRAVEVASIEIADPAWFEIGQYAAVLLVRAMSPSTLGRHGEAVATARQTLDNALLRSPNSTFAIQVAWVLLRADCTQEALDLVAQPTRLALGVAIE